MVMVTFFEKDTFKRMLRIRNGTLTMAATSPTPWLTLLAISSPGDRTRVAIDMSFGIAGTDLCAGCRSMSPLYSKPDGKRPDRH